MSTGAYGNPNLMFVGASAFFDFGASSESISLPTGTRAIECRASADCWVKVGIPGENTTAAAPSAEKTWVERTYAVRADEEKVIAVPVGTDENPVKVAVIQATAAGVLDITTRY